MYDTALVNAISDLTLLIMGSDEPEFYSRPGILPLSAGRILLGRQHIAERSSPSRIVFVPVNSKFGPPSTKSQWIQSGTSVPGYQARLRHRPLATDAAQYLVYCWGQSGENTHDLDFDATRWLAHTVMRACARLAMTSVSFFTAEGWIDQRTEGAAVYTAGHEFCFGVSLSIPVTDSGVALTPDLAPQLPNGLAISPTIDMETG